jgi:hypothetical protein
VDPAPPLLLVYLLSEGEPTRQRTSFEKSTAPALLDRPLDDLFLPLVLFLLAANCYITGPSLGAGLIIKNLVRLPEL